MTKDIATVKAAVINLRRLAFRTDEMEADIQAHVAYGALDRIETALSSPPAAPTPENNGVDIDWDDICFRVAEKLYGHDKNVWSLPYADLNVIRPVQEFIDQQLYERATNPPPPALDKG